MAVSATWRPDCNDRLMGIQSICVPDLASHLPYSCAIDRPPFASSAFLIEPNARYARMQYALPSGNGTTVAEHKHITVLLEQ